ncbi:acyl carrier protein [Streptomyces sp. NPDC088194]|uniref:acyl carrier protein n=1 Tax=Streptomyces sp. NPDC088194 TaxID=3154931 RepID=UPI00344BD76F
MTAAPEIRAELLDCFQSNLAVLADRYHGAGTHLRLGAALRLRTRPGPHGLPTVEPSLDEALADAADLLGLALAQKWPGADGDWARSLRETAWVVADAYHLPWVPYHGQRHIEHSFLAEPDGDGALAVTDAYHNDTPWGAARPTRLLLEREELAAVLDAGPGRAFQFAPTPLDPARLDPPGEEVRISSAGADDYLRPYAEHPDRKLTLDQFTMETWLLARSRRLRAAYLAQGDAGTPQHVAEHLARWDGLVEYTYLTSRRVARGRAEPPDLLPRAAELLHADWEVLCGGDRGAGDIGAAGAAGAAGGGPPSPEQVASTVAGIVGRVLGIRDVPAPDADLTGLPAFNSLRMLEIVDGLEEGFAIEFGPGDLLPERLHRIVDLCELVERRLNGGAG